MTRMRRPALVLCAVLTALHVIQTAAWAGPPPPPTPPAPYRAPLWPVPEPGRWQPAPGQSASDSSASRPHKGGSGAADERMVDAVNRQRKQAGCSPVRLHRALDRAAQNHSSAMARTRRLTHTGTDGSSPADRMRAAGYRVGSAGENVAAGSDTAEAAVTVWMRSAPHRDILLTCRYTHAGVGRAKGSGGPWWTLDLASAR
ncbi:CAP domain-containing protein [Streptomyces sp. NPDC018321]|uniref:CAP domain-containing protein n=1 Tax=Streptomyces sp. NPDC018321 TaxID=3365043 RepID=UPI00378A1D83